MITQILKGERQRCQQIYDSYERRLVAIPGGCAMAAAFATYLGPYHHNFRRMMLTVHWPNCLRERGVPLVIDSIDGLKGWCDLYCVFFLSSDWCYKKKRSVIWMDSYALYHVQQFLASRDECPGS